MDIPAGELESFTLKDQIKAIFKGSGWILHTCYWLVMFLLAYIRIRIYGNADHLPSNFIIAAAAVRFSCLFTLCYIYLLFLIPRYGKYHPLKFWGLLLLTIAVFDFLYVYLVSLIAGSYPTLAGRRTLALQQLIGDQGLGFVLLFTVFIAFYYFREIFVQQKEIQLLAKYKTEKIALESSFLKSQVNPHFLFNTLNNIYALSLKKSPQTPQIIERLESLLHYMLYDCKADEVRLADEFTFTNSYIALEKLRHRDEFCEVTVNITGEIEEQRIAPLLLVNFLENAFKHGTKTTFGKSWITMDIFVEPDSMRFVLENSKPLQISSRQAISEYTGGIGLKNVKRRLEILYPDNHRLQITDKKDRFGVDLVLNF